MAVSVKEAEQRPNDVHTEIHRRAAKKSMASHRDSCDLYSWLEMRRGLCVCGGGLMSTLAARPRRDRHTTLSLQRNA